MEGDGGKTVVVAACSPGRVAAVAAVAAADRSIDFNTEALEGRAE